MANKAIDTGTGGFHIDDTLHAYDPGVDDPSGDKGVWSSGDIPTKDITEDISKGTKRTLASYMSDVTLGRRGAAKVSNAYPVINTPAEDPVSISLSDTAGYPVPPEMIADTQPHFTKRAPETLGSLTSRSSKAAESGFEDNFGRGRTNKSYSGNNLLESAAPVAPPATAGYPPPSTLLTPGTPVEKYTSVMTNNRFASAVSAGQDNRFSNDATFESYLGHSNYPLITPKFVKGTHDEDPNSKRLSYDQMTGIGQRLTEAAMGDAKQLLVKTSLAQLEVSKIVEDIANEDNGLGAQIGAFLAGEGPGPSYVNINENTWGNLNSAVASFDGATMEAMATALVAGLAALIQGLTSIMPGGSTTTLMGGDSAPTGRSFITADKQHRLIYGKSVAYSPSSADYSNSVSLLKTLLGGKFDFWSFIGIAPTSKPTDDCVAAGCLAFFQIDGTSLTSYATAGFSAPGQSAIVGRTITRSFLAIADSFKSIIDAFKNIAKDPLSASQALGSIVSFITTLKNSRFVSMLGLFSKLGDFFLGGSQYSNNDDWEDGDARAAGSFGKKFSKMDAEDNTRLSVQRKSRLKITGVNPSPPIPHLAWSTFRTRDKLLLPPNIRQAVTKAQSAENLDAPDEIRTPQKIAKWGATEMFNSVEGRISTEDREKFEEELESEYVPFYLHDLRTNEILSFHAFLSKLDDSYTANYDSVDAYGRIDPIKVYKNTSRKIGFTFLMAALSEEDFHTMWIKINKLVTLVYPQFTEGKRVTDADNKKYNIVMPFSQQIGAAPMVRLRIGDVIQSNYSRFNLARLFGFPYAGSIINGKPVDFSSTASTESFEDRFQKEIYKSVSSGGSDQYKYTLNSAYVKKWIKYLPQLGVTLKEGYRLVKADTAPVNVDPGSPNSGGDEYAVPMKVINVDASKKDAELEAFIAEKRDKTPDGLATATILVNPVYLKPDADTRKKLYKDIAAGGPASYMGAVDELMSTNPERTNAGNVVAKSFRTTGGRGLPGFIESISFNWLDKGLWSGLGQETGAVGRRAPNICEINVSYQPIHDIAPGIDHKGYNRAPVYPVAQNSFRK